MVATYPHNMDQIQPGAPRQCLSCYGLFLRISFVGIRLKVGKDLHKHIIQKLAYQIFEILSRNIFLYQNIKEVFEIRKSGGLVSR